MLNETGHDAAAFECDGPDDFLDSEGDTQQSGPSLTDDLFALFENSKTYAKAEMAFQKSRAGFVANRAKGAIVFGLGAFGVLHLALIALTVGLVIALVPIVGPWVATMIVTAGLVITGVILLMLLKSRIDDIRDTFSDMSDD